MLHDNYQIRSDFRKSRGATSISLGEFLNGFEDFFYKIERGKNPDLAHKLCDPYGFAVLCKDYGITNIDLNLSCKENFINNCYTDSNPYVGQFNFKTLIEYLHRAYWFDKHLALKIYEIQRSALSIFKQIINGQGYVVNRYGYNKQNVRKYMNYAMESKIALDENFTIPKPYIHKVCDGMVWPCIVTKNTSPVYTIKNIDLHGWGNGLFLCEGQNIIDVLRINDLWLVDSPLENRLKFLFKIKNENVAEYLKVWNLREAIQAGKLLGANSTDGLLLRSCHENYIDNRWFLWNQTSYIYCYNVNNKLITSSRGRSVPDYYTLMGDLGEVHPFEQRQTERVWLDDFDIQEFQRILELKS